MQSCKQGRYAALPCLRKAANKEGILHLPMQSCKQEGYTALACLCRAANKRVYCTCLPTGANLPAVSQNVCVYALQLLLMQQTIIKLLTQCTLPSHTVWF